MNTAIKIIEPSGILDGTKATQLREEIDSLIDSSIEAILVDFKQVTFMDSSGLGALVLCLKNARSVGVKLCICSLNDQIKMLFELTNTERFFEILVDRATFEQIFAVKNCPS
jgi:anti-sigma B factor antagonist